MQHWVITDETLEQMDEMRSLSPRMAIGDGLGEGESRSALLT
jgi:hypothetical protein